MRILLSIKPKYVEKIFSGAKRFEFRKAIHKKADVKTVVVYATKPVGKVVGEFTVSGVHSDCPRRLWTKTKKAAGISRPSFQSYFAGRDVGFAIEVGEVRRYPKPLNVIEFLPHGHPPQSFVYLPTTVD